MSNHVKQEKDDLMGLISVNDLRPGMVLAGDVRDRNNRVLLAAGQEISDKHLKIFKMWGVTDADVRGAVQEDMVVQDMAEVDPAVYQDAEQVTRDVFQNANVEHPGMKELARLATLRRAKPKAEGRHG
jgi:hypothetical protein